MTIEENPAAGREGQRPSVVYRWINSPHGCKSKIDSGAAFLPHLVVALKDSTEEASSQWVELLAVHLIIYFLWKQKQPKVSGQ